jgi:hypothetical protein
MELQMYLNGKLLDAVIIAPGTPGLNILQQKLEDKHNEILELSAGEPEYYIAGIGSKMEAGIFKEAKKPVRN